MKKSILLVLLVLGASSAFGLKRRNAPQLPTDVKAFHAVVGKECQQDLQKNFSAYDLGSGAKLYLVPCYMGAYQGPSLGYITTKSAGIQIVSVLTKTDVGPITSTIELVNASYDHGAKSLYVSQKGRGLGDCGSYSESKIEVTDYGVSIVTKEIRYKEACDGEYSEEWPVVFQQ